MSKPKEVVQAMYAAYGAGNMEALKNTLSDDIQWIYHGTDEIEHSGVYKGKKGVTKFFSNVNEHIDYIDFQPSQFIAEENMVVVLGNEKQKIKEMVKYWIKNGFKYIQLRKN